ncbi:hypothetical protein Fmac_006685 [Flemingia macrophylla]|uniref:Uncharacterized protein n=1 Tax=Flemingia macrophylla TaxID=520843 RepID=A0ABD1NBB9_9FABA
MKPHVSGEASLANESRRSAAGEKLHQVCKAAMVAITTTNHRTNQRLGRRQEEPIRTLMFLGSWSHT